MENFRRAFQPSIARTCQRRGRKNRPQNGGGNENAVCRRTRGREKFSPQQSKLSIEMAARKLRHEFFARDRAGAKNQNDCARAPRRRPSGTFFLRLLRGAGGEGLAGMKWRSPSPADKTISLVRPLLDFSKNELAEFARENKIHFRDDATNFSSDFLRNRIRNELLPLLRKNYQPGLNKTILRLMEIVGAESEFVGEAAKKIVG